MAELIGEALADPNSNIRFPIYDEIPEFYVGNIIFVGRDRYFTTWNNGKYGKLSMPYGWSLKFNNEGEEIEIEL
jgi:hypothetical protein